MGRGRHADGLAGSYSPERFSVKTEAATLDYWTLDYWTLTTWGACAQRRSRAKYSRSSSPKMWITTSL